MPASPSSSSRWLDEALSGWILPVTALAAVLVVGALYAAGLAGEEAVATAVVLAVGVGVGLYLLRPALQPQREPATRALVAAAAALTGVAVALPALATVYPGAPLAAGQLAQVHETLALPADAHGEVRLLVSGRLADRGEPAVDFVLTGPREPVEGRLQRTFSYARVGRGGRARVAHDHTADYYPATLPPGARAIELDRLQGQLGGALTVQVYREPIPVRGGPWILAALAVLAASVAEARLGKKSDLAVAAGMGVAFGLLVTYNATPAAAMGPALGGVLLGAICGSLVGWIAGAVVRRFVPVAGLRSA